MRRLAVLVALFVGLIGFAAPAASAKPDLSSPAQLCKSWFETREQERPTGTEDVTAYWVPMLYPGGFELDLPILSLGGCVSTVANGGGQVPVPFDALSVSAINSQCKAIEPLFGGYPYSFYGIYPAKNRADCIYYLGAFHRDELPTPG